MMRLQIVVRADFSRPTEMCDEVTHAAEPAKFDNAGKSAQR
jgi:hypothetical protein